jgi:predicted transglutaminase-like cysteine proteinase
MNASTAVALVWQAIALCVVSGPAFSQSTAVKYSPSVFRSLEARFDDTNRFTKWISMLERKLEQQPELDTKGCGFKLNEACGPYFWRKFVAEISTEGTWTKIIKVNEYLNQFRYVTDFDNWGIADFWETPLEFLERRGDCEDYAIAKYVTLKKLGIDPDSMRIVALNDTNLKTGHAVLMLKYSDQTYILDNQSRGVIPEENIRHYQAVYSINERHWWLHIYR